MTDSSARKWRSAALGAGRARDRLTRRRLESAFWDIRLRPHSEFRVATPTFLKWIAVAAPAPACHERHCGANRILCRQSGEVVAPSEAVGVRIASRTSAEGQGKAQNTSLGHSLRPATWNLLGVASGCPLQSPWWLVRQHLDAIAAAVNAAAPGSYMEVEIPFK